MKTFTPEERKTLEEILLHRRDVRGNRFSDKPLEDEVIENILFAGVNAPSVGFSQPWEFVVVKDEATKVKIKDSFSEENAAGAEQFEGERRTSYEALKLEGIAESAINIAVFYKPSDGPVLGQTSMKEAGLYSVVCAIQNMWLMARALNVGLGWVSILDPDKVKKILNVPEENTLVGYLCLGYVDEFYDIPELETLKWERRKGLDEVVHWGAYSSNM